MSRNLIRISLLVSCVLMPLRALAKDKAPAKTPEPAPTETAAEDGERVNVDKIKEKYWARGDESELGVVQNRLYSKARRFELGLLGGFLGSDPFLSVKALGVSLGYHFNEYFSAHLLGWKAYASDSSAKEVLEAGGKRANTNPPSGFYGAEARASLLYGKLSLVGRQIVYYDFHFIAGAGGTQTETGTYATPYGGLGQQVFLSKSASLNIDYRIMRYVERSKEKEITTKLGQLNEPRTNWTHAITLGLSFFIGN